MRKMLLIACLALLPLLTGCTVVSDVLFGIFSDGYTGGGDTRAQKQAHFDRQGQSSDHYQPWDR